MITPDALKFLEEARMIFNNDKSLSTYRNNEFIALRSGMFEDGIKIFSLGDEVGNFIGQLERPDIKFIPNDEYKRLKSIEEESKKVKVDKLHMPYNIKILYNIKDDELNVEVFEDEDLLTDFLSEHRYLDDWYRVNKLNLHNHARSPYYL